MANSLSYIQRYNFLKSNKKSKIYISTIFKKRNKKSKEKIVAGRMWSMAVLKSSGEIRNRKDAGIH